MRFIALKSFVIGIFVVLGVIVPILVLGACISPSCSVFYIQTITAGGSITFLSSDNYPTIDKFGMYQNSDCSGGSGGEVSGGTHYTADIYIPISGGNLAEGCISPIIDHDYFLCFGDMSEDGANYSGYIPLHRISGSWTTEAVPPTIPMLFGISPLTGIEITDLTATFEFGYSSFDFDTSSGYAGFVVNFKDNKIGANANSIQYLKNNLDPSGSGTKIITLSDFGFDSNGIWKFTGLGFGTHLDIEGGMFLTGRGYVDFWTDDLATPDYTLLINVPTLPTPYSFSEPTAWYETHQSRFATPTAFFADFVNLISPIFENVGEFGVRAQEFFNKTEAYDRGYALGAVFPIIGGYIQKIDLFFGGFPLASFLIYLILVMAGIFIIRVVMKFIPFFG
jgi:hypothetical protein